MRKVRLVIFAILVVCMCVSGCTDNYSDDNDVKEYVVGEYEELANAPSEEYIIACLKETPTVLEVESENSESNNSEFAKLNGCVARVYFSSELIEQDEISGDSVLEKGTSCGGSIEIFTSYEQAKDRNNYLAKFDNGVLDSGSHTVVGTLVIRTSNKLSREQQIELTQNIISVITSGEVEIETNIEETTEKETSSLTDVTEPTVNNEVATSEATTSVPKPESLETESATENNNSTTDLYEKDSESEYLDITATDIQVRYETDYAHTDSEIVFLGNDESVTISITIYRTDVYEEDLIISYDDELLNVETEGLVSGDSKTTMELYVTGKTECETDIVIGTSYEFETFGEEADGYILDIRKLNDVDGRIVYASTTGKYHFSSKCAGGSAKKSTYRDALIYEYDACKKCAN